MTPEEKPRFPQAVIMTLEAQRSVELGLCPKDRTPLTERYRHSAFTASQCGFCHTVYMLSTEEGTKMSNQAPIARLADTDDECSICREPAAVVVRGNYPCYYCGNEVFLCEKHQAQVVEELTLMQRMRGTR